MLFSFGFLANFHAVKLKKKKREKKRVFPREQGWKGEKQHYLLSLSFLLLCNFLFIREFLLLHQLLTLSVHLPLVHFVHTLQFLPYVSLRLISVRYCVIAVTELSTGIHVCILWTHKHTHTQTHAHTHTQTHTHTYVCMHACTPPAPPHTHTHMHWKFILFFRSLLPNLSSSSFFQNGLVQYACFRHLHVKAMTATYQLDTNLLLYQTNLGRNHTVLDVLKQTESHWHCNGIT